MVSSVVTAGAIQKTLRLHSEGGILEWPSNIPASEVWIEAIEDKGGGRVHYKFICCERAALLRARERSSPLDPELALPVRCVGHLWPPPTHATSPEVPSSLA
jgi:hypothetical protein